jgi:hypothetical protein
MQGKKYRKIGKKGNFKKLLFSREKITRNIYVTNVVPGLFSSDIFLLIDKKNDCFNCAMNASMSLSSGFFEGKLSFGSSAGLGNVFKTKIGYGPMENIAFLYFLSDLYTALFLSRRRILAFFYR